MSSLPSKDGDKVPNKGMADNTPSLSTRSSSDDSSVHGGGGGVRLSVSSLHSSQDAAKLEKGKGKTDSSTEASIVSGTSPIITISDGINEIRLKDGSHEEVQAATAVTKRNVLVNSIVPGEDIFASPHYGKSIFNKATALAPEQYSKHLSTQTSGEIDPQKRFPGCTVFVANLPEKQDELALIAGVTKLLCGCGSVYVKIRRDMHNMPYAFATFTTRESMRNALQFNGHMVLGRPCRVEIARANLDFLVRTLSGAIITAAEAVDLLREFGGISSTQTLEEGIIVSFKDFDESRDLVAAFRDHPYYVIKPYDLRKGMVFEKLSKDEAFLHEYNINRCSIYISSLPQEVEVETLSKAFKKFGNIVDVQIFKRGGKRTFSFIRFSDAEAAQKAIDLKHMTLDGHLIDIERKKSKEEVAETNTSSRPMLRHSKARNPLRVASTRGPSRQVSQQCMPPPAGCTPARGHAGTFLNPGISPSRGRRQFSMGPMVTTQGHAMPPSDQFGAPPAQLGVASGQFAASSGQFGPSAGHFAATPDHLVAPPAHRMVAPGHTMAPGNGNMLSPPGGMPDQNMPQTAFSYLSPHAAYSTPGYGNGTQVTSPAAPFMYQPVSHGYGAPGAPYLPTSQAYMYAMTPSPAVGPSTSGPLAEERTSEAGLENARAGNTA